MADGIAANVILIGLVIDSLKTGLIQREMRFRLDLFLLSLSAIAYHTVKNGEFHSVDNVKF